METRKPHIEYQLQHRHSAEHIELKFTGTLLKQQVVWHAHIRTLRDYCLHEMTIRQTPAQSQPFIDINVNDNIHSLTVALNLPVIDEAAILRTIIMIRQYKRLQPGRHYYGDICSFHFNTN